MAQEVMWQEGGALQSLGHMGGVSSLRTHKLRAVQSTTNVQRPRTRLGGAGLVKTIDSIHLWNGIGNIEIVMQTLRL